MVNHFNLGQQFLLEEGEKQQVAELNFEAGLRAKSANAYANAARYFTTCTELLGQEGWQRQYRLTFSAHRYLAQALFLSGNFQQALVVIEFTRERAQSLLDRAEIYSLKIAQATMEARYSEAIDSGLEALAMVGIDLREEADLKLAIEREIAEIEQKLNGREVIDLLALPEMKAPDIKAIVKLLIDLDAPTYITSQIDLYGFINVKAVSLSIEYGNCVESVKAYANYGLILGYLQGKYQLGYQFGNLAIQLSDRLKSPSQKSKACLLVGGWIQVWSQPIIGAEKINFEGFKSGLESGEIQFAGYNIFAKISNLIFQGCPLNVIRETIEQYWDFADKSQNQLLLEALTGMEEYAMTLTEISVREGTRFRGVTEEEFIVRCQRSQSFLALCLYYVLKMEIACIYGKFDEGLKSAVAATEILGSIQGFTTFAKYGYYASLIYLNLEEGLSSEEVNAYQQQLQIWMESCPENFSCMYFLVAAERHRRQQQKLEAIELYDRAIAEAKANGFIHQEALANELAAKFYFNWGKEKIARTYLIDAYYCYSQWGAKAKVADLEKRYRQLLAPIFQSDKTSLATNATISAIRDGKTSSTNTDTNILLDFASAFKASMAIAGEIELVGLLSKLMEVVMENAGATKSALLLLTGDTLVMEAIAGYSEDGTLEMMSLENSLPVESNSELPQSIINTVKRSEEALVINDLSKQTRFASDLYLLQYQPQSILCMPLLDRGQLRGILYLENQLTTGVFSSDRLELLKVLAAQAAISLENARLYQSLEQKVAERTQELNDKSENLQATLTELQQTQAQLIQTEKMSSLGRMVAGIAHEINNPTTFIQGNIEPARHYFEDLLELIKIYQEDVPNASSRISEKLEEIELDYLQEDLEKIFASMRNGCDRIRAIVQGLRTFSRLDEAKTKFTDLHANLDSTLMLLEHRLLNSELGVPIEVIRTYGTLPKVTCNISLINQVFFEIISNAIDAICSKKEDLESDPPAIKITTETVDAQRVKITISDNGEGMSEETRAKIFDPFFSTKSVGKGTGLGLSTSYQIIVGEHGGTLSCSSELLRGTKLTLTLPVVPLKSLPTSDTVF